MSKTGEKVVPPFVHLHVHTEYSMLDGLNRIPKLVEKVKNDGMNAVAITDHGVLYGVYDFWQACNDAEIKPIIGSEIYVAPSERTFRQEVDGIKYYHLVLLAKNLTGYHNLIKIVSIGHLEGMYYRPRVDREILEKYSEGIICASACPQGPLGKHILRDEPAKAKEWLEFLHATYKKDFYLELQRHGLHGSDDVNPLEQDQYDNDQYTYMLEQSKINTQLRAWSKEYGIPLIATTDAHYLEDTDDLTQEVLFAIKDGKTLTDPTRRLAYKHTSVKTRGQMASIYDDLPEVMENTQKLADSVEHYSITFTRDEAQPRYLDIPKGKTPRQELQRQAYEGAVKRYGKLTDTLKERIDYEIEIIDQKGYADYYLVTGDYIQWAREQNIVVSMRGSGAASVVAYCMEITSIDPLWWNLMFERFLNPKRPSPPDFDLDLEDQNRDKVLQYIVDKYGRDAVVAICAFGRMQSRAAIRDVCRVLGINLKTADMLSKMIPVNFGKPKPLKDMVEHNKEFAAIIKTDPQLEKMVEIVGKIEGMKRHVSTHACGVLITPKPATEYIPVQFEVGKTSQRVITQIEGATLEPMGLMKFDLLGLANLTIIRNTIELANKLHNAQLTINTIPLDDKQTYEVFQRGDTTSVFQFEGDGMKKYLRELKPDSIRDLCFMAAAYRPGPITLIPDAILVKHGKKDPTYIMPELEPILRETYGAVIYQEQIMQIAVSIAGYESMGDADLLRKSIAKKKREVLAKEEPRFKEGIVNNGFSQTQADALWDILLPFADYAFPKAHSAMYAVVAYWTAYLKAHYPLEFMCARLSADMEKPDKLAVALEEAKHIGLTILPPDINKSGIDFHPEGETSIRYGFNGIKFVGSNVVDEMVRERDENGTYSHLDEFCARVPSLNAKSLESLIKVGALDAFGERGALLAVQSQILTSRSRAKVKSKADQLDMFAESVPSGKKVSPATPLPSAEPVPTAEKLHWEKELLGIYFTAHPLQEAAHALSENGYTKVSESPLVEGASVNGYALLSDFKQITTKSGDPMAFVTLDDMLQIVEGVIFPRDYERMKPLLVKGTVVLIRGKCNYRDDKVNVIINDIRTVDAKGMIARENKTPSLGSRVNSENGQKHADIYLQPGASQNDLAQLRDILYENEGDVAISVHLQSPSGERVFHMKKPVDNTVLTTLIEKMKLVEKIEYTSM